MGHPIHQPALLAACLAGLLAGAAPGQTGPGLPGLIYDQAELFQPIATIGTGQQHGHSTLHDGWLTVFRYNPGGIDFYDASNPYAPELVQTVTTNLADMSEPHTLAQTTHYGGQAVIVARGAIDLGGTGFAIVDLTDVFAPKSVAYDIPGVTGGYATGIFWLFYQAPYVYCGAGSLGLYVIDASVPGNPSVARHMPTSQTGGFNAVNTLAVGNTLIVTNSDGGPGMARFDISDPTDPQLQHSTTSTSIPYGINLNGGRLLVAVVSGPVNSPTGGNGSFEVRGLGPSFPVVNQAPLPSRGGTTIAQDQYAHVAASTGYRKVDIGDEAGYVTVGGAAMPNPGGDWDWVTPIGNLAVLGDDQGFGTQLVPHASLPDSSGPRVTMIDPEDGAVGCALTSRVGITVSDMVRLESIDQASFTVRPVGGAALDGSYSNQFGIVNFTPAQELQPDTTYEVVVPAGGLVDFAGNAATETFVSRFSTGAQVTAIDVQVQLGPPVEPGQTASFDVASVTGTGPFQFSWDFGDGTGTPFSSSSQATHAYTQAGHYSVLVSVTDGSLTATDSYLQTVHHPLTAARPTGSSTLALDEPRNRLWCVNPDNDTVTAIDTVALAKAGEYPVGAHPRTLALAPDGSLWVVCQDDATVRVLDPQGAPRDTIALPPGSGPFAIAFTPNGQRAFVTLRATGRVAELDPVARTWTGTIKTGPEPSGLAIAADSERVFATRFVSSSLPRTPSVLPASGPTISPLPGPPAAPFPPAAEVYELSAAAGALVRTIPLAMDSGPDTETSGRGLPNYLASPAISPDGRRLRIPSKKDNIERGLFRDGQTLGFDSTVRTIASEISLLTSKEVPDARIDFNDRDLAAAVVYSPLGDYAFHALQGSNAIDVRDAYTGALVAGIDGTGLAPQGLALTGDGARLFVHNFMSRTVTVHDASGVTAATSFALPLLAEVQTVASEALDPQVLRGKRIFYNASDPRMNEDGYLSCASCHLDGGHDGRIWDFTDRGEGLRNTISLRGKAGTAQGRLHWTANFDEVQDFEGDIRQFFGGDGFMDDGLFNSGTVGLPLGQPKAGLSAPLDALSAYLESLDDVGRSPHRAPGGTLTAAGQRGRALFLQLACDQCHSGPDFTDSATGMEHDVGTLKPSSGLASGGPLTGLDTPTLRGLWASDPYLHDGSAATLMEVLTTQNQAGLHGDTQGLTASERADLVAYLLQIDDLEPAPPLPQATAAEGR